MTTAWTPPLPVPRDLLPFSLPSVRALPYSGRLQIFLEGPPTNHCSAEPPPAMPDCEPTSTTSLNSRLQVLATLRQSLLARSRRTLESWTREMARMASSSEVARLRMALRLPRARKVDV